jgi:Ca2+-binding RTX toxin-like protein
VADTLIGGIGNDTYQVDAGDIVIEEYDPFGEDRVQARVDYALGDHVENLALMNGFGEIDGRGNSLDNTIDGNNSANTLIGGGGYDEITGRRGNDVLIGGDGHGSLEADGFFFNVGDGIDTIRDFVAGDDSGDFILLGGYAAAFRVHGFDELMSYMSQQGNDVVIAFDAANQITLSNVTLGSLNAQDFAIA